MINRILKAVIVLFLIAAGYFIYQGAANVEDTIVTRVEIQADPSIVFDFITDPDKVGEWLTGLRSMEKISGEDMEVGATYELVFKEGKRDMVIMETITAIEQDARFAFIMEDDFLSGTIDITLTPTTTGTLLQEVNVYRGRTFVARAITGVFKMSIRNAKRGMYEGLAEVSEQAAA